MNRLPSELVHKIVRLVYNREDPTCIDNLLLVSRCFHIAVEACTGRFRSKTIHGDGEGENQIRMFAEYFQKYRRAASLDDVVYVVYPRLPYGMPANPAFWSFDDLAQLNNSVTAQIYKLFGAIYSLERHPEPESRPRRIRLEIRSSPDSCYRLWPFWRQRLISSHHLPNLESVTYFQLGEAEWYSPTALESSMIAQLLPKFPNLEELKAPYLHDDPCAEFIAGGTPTHVEVYQGPRKDARDAFSKTIRKVVELGYLPPRLYKVDLHFGHAITGRQQDQTRMLPNLTSPYRCDPLSSSLRLLTLNVQNLRKLTLWGSFDLSLLVSLTADQPNHAMWPNLEKLRVVFFVEAPDGSWYFQERTQQQQPQPAAYTIDHTHYPSPSPCPVPTSPRANRNGSGHHAMGSFAKPVEQHMSRMVPIACKVEPLLEAFATATTQMPSLRKSSLWFPLQLLSEDDFHDLTPSKHVCHNAWGINWELTPFVSSAVWMTLNWRPSPRVHSLLRDSWKRGAVPMDEQWVEYLEAIDRTEDGRSVKWPL